MQKICSIDSIPVLLILLFIVGKRSHVSLLSGHLLLRLLAVAGVGAARFDVAAIDRAWDRGLGPLECRRVPARHRDMHVGAVDSIRCPWASASLAVRLAVVDIRAVARWQRVQLRNHLVAVVYPEFLPREDLKKANLVMSKADGVTHTMCGTTRVSRPAHV